MIPKLEQEQQSLERKIAVNRITYESLLKRLQEVQLVENQKVSNARILAPAVEPDQAIASKLKNNLVMSGALALALAIATAIILQNMDTLLRTTDDIERVFADYPLLGVLPKFGKNGQAGKMCSYAPNPVPKLAKLIGCCKQSWNS
ncbi:MAG: hypothetical protein HC770_03905 [Pseudanabaena sp. CRU_2_10]|nr:hypothetical protein [Pseudanabaena sp. CRU_2_10]